MVTTRSLSVLALLCSASIFPHVALAVPAYPDHCVQTGYPGLESCPTPPLDVAQRLIPAELHSWGVPPAPNRTKSPQAYDTWFKSHFLMRHSVLARGAFKVADKHFGIADLGTLTPQISGRVEANLVANDARWFGYSLDKSFSAPSSLILTYMSANIVMPGIKQANPCSGQYTQSEGSFWVGIDGESDPKVQASSDVLQGGVIQDVICSGSTAYEVLTPFIEFAPNPAICVPFSNAKVNPKDEMLFQAAQDGSSPTEGYALVADVTQNLSAAYLLHAASGYSYNGYSAEAIAERACQDAQGLNCNALPDFGAVQFTNANATDSNGNTDPIGANVGSAPIDLYTVKHNAVVSGQTYGTGTMAAPATVGARFENSGVANVLTNACGIP